MDVVFQNIDFVRATLRPDQLSIQSVLAEETRDDVVAVGRWCDERGIHHSIQHYSQGGFEGSWTPIAASPSEMDAHHGLKASACMAADRNLSIMPDGSVFTCFQQALIQDSASPIGRLGDMPIHEMLNSAYTDAVRRRMRSCALPCKVLKCNQ